MAIQVTIIGLGQIGASMGLALAKIKDQAVRIGSDREPSINRQAEKMGVVDKTQINLPSAVKDADIVILAVPTDEIRETMEVIAQDLKPGVVLIDTSPLVAPAMQWARELITGEDRYFASLIPAINPEYLMETSRGIDAAHADLFKNCPILITTMPGIDDSAITLVSNLTQILGGTALFTDATEADGLMAYTQLLPQLVSAALVNATVDQSGWREARKVAGQAYAQATEPALFLEERKAFGQTALLNADNTVRMLDQMIEELRKMREAIAKQDASAVQEQLNHALQERELWWNQRMVADWEVKATTHIPTSGEFIGRLFGLRPKKDKDQK